jgi:hypothetical protein
MSTTSTQNQLTDSADALSKLHKMSTTAGVASQQYVAVNSAAVAAALLGVASALTIFSPLLLVIPLAGMIVAVAAWRQIGNSNGTETGKGVAALGLALSLLIGGAVLGKELLDNAHSRADAHQMAFICTQLNDAIKADRYDAAYNLFDINFRSRVSPQQFEAKLRVLQSPRNNGRIHSIIWNGVPPAYEKIEGGNGMLGVIYTAIKFDAGEGRFTFVFRKVSEGWQLMNIMELFPMQSKG